MIRRLGPGAKTTAARPLRVAHVDLWVWVLADPCVVDASVMPAIPRANINLTCIMIGEHVAAWMRDET